MSYRALLVKLIGTLSGVNINKVYAKTTEGSEDGVNAFYSELSNALQMCRHSEINMMGYLNAKVLIKQVGFTVGKYELGKDNYRGCILVEYVFRYLGTLITADGICIKEFICRIVQEKSVFHNLKHISLSIDVIKSVPKSYILS